MLALRRPAPLAAALATALIAGCGTASGDASLAGSASGAGTATVSVHADVTAGSPVPATSLPAPPATTRPAPPATTRPAPAPVPAPEAPGLPWPSATASGAAALQKAVDDGGQPWMLDPTDVAESYGSFRGWNDVRASGAGATGPTRVTVRSSAGTHTLTLAQPGRTGQGGIWLVTADSTG